MSDSLLVAALYKFVPLDDVEARRDHWLELCIDAGIHGILLVASEGINGTIAGPEESVRAVLSALRSDPLLSDL